MVCESCLKKYADIIRDGKTRRFGPEIRSYNHPAGWQGILRTLDGRAVYIVYSFGSRESIPLPGGWEIRNYFGSGKLIPDAEGKKINCVSDGLVAGMLYLESSL